MALKRVTGRRRSLRRVIFFQLRLIADAGRDFIMSPLSIMCFVLDFVLGSKEGEGYYDRLMHLGRRSDRYINLFEQHAEGEPFVVEQSSDQN